MPGRTACRRSRNRTSKREHLPPVAALPSGHARACPSASSLAARVAPLRSRVVAGGTLSGEPCSEEEAARINSMIHRGVPRGRRRCGHRRRQDATAARGGERRGICAFLFGGATNERAGRMICFLFFFSRSLEQRWDLGQQTACMGLTRATSAPTRQCRPEGGYGGPPPERSLTPSGPRSYSRGVSPASMLNA
jgi:hypothetical protein